MKVSGCVSMTFTFDNVFSFLKWSEPKPPAARKPGGEGSRATRSRRERFKKREKHRTLRVLPNTPPGAAGGAAALDARKAAAADESEAAASDKSAGVCVRALACAWRGRVQQCVSVCVRL